MVWKRTDALVSNRGTVRRGGPVHVDGRSSAETDGGFQTYRNEENGDHCKAEEGDIGCGWSQRRAADLPDGNYG